MSARKTNPGKWSEEDVESLLVDFFEHEMPRDLPRLAGSSVAGCSNAGSRFVPSQSARERRSAGYKGLGVVVCVLLLAVTALSPSGQRLLSPNATDIDPSPRVAVKSPSPKNTTSSIMLIKKNRPRPELHPAILDVLPPEMRHPIDNFPPVRVEGDGLDFWDLLDIEILRPFSPVTPPNDKRPRLPEEGE